MKYKNDLMLIGALLIVCFIAFGAVCFQKNASTDELQIYVDGNRLASLSAGQDACILLYEENGSRVWERFDSMEEAEHKKETVSSYNLIAIDSGTVSVCDADCGGRDCVRQRGISGTGESIICLPHKVLLCLTGADKPAEDAVTW